MGEQTVALWRASPVDAVASSRDEKKKIGVIRHNRQCEEQDSGQGGHSSGPAALNLRRQAVGRWEDAQRLQHPEGEHAALGAASAWWTVVTFGMEFWVAKGLTIS